MTIPPWVVTEPLLQVEHEVIADRVDIETSDPWPDVRISFRGESMPWTDAVRECCRQAGLDVVINAEAGDPVDIEFDGTPFGSAIRELATLVEMSARLDGSVVVFERDVVESVGAVPLGYTDPEEIARVVEDVAPDMTQVSLAGGRVIVGGSASAVDQATAVGVLIGATPPGQWFVEVCVLSMRRDWRVNLGVEGTIGGVVVFDPNEASELSALLDGSLIVEASRSVDELVLRAGLVLLEGAPATLDSSDEIPVPQKTVSPEGTVSTSGFEMVRAGVSLVLNGYAVPGDAMRVTIEPELSDVIGFVAERPIVSRRRVSTTVIVGDNQVVLLSGLWGERHSTSHSVPAVIGNATSGTEWVVVARFRRM